MIENNGVYHLLSNGTKIWYVPHKMDMLTSDVTSSWWHRMDGPAVEGAYGVEHEWWYDNEQYDFEEFIVVANIKANDITILKLKYGS